MQSLKVLIWAHLHGLEDQEKKTAWQSQKPTYAALIPQNNPPHAVSAPARSKTTFTTRNRKHFTWSCCRHVTLTTYNENSRKTVAGLSFRSIGDAGYPMIKKDCCPSGGTHFFRYFAFALVRKWRCHEWGFRWKIWLKSCPSAHRCRRKDGQWPPTGSIMQGETYDWTIPTVGSRVCISKLKLGLSCNSIFWKNAPWPWRFTINLRNLKDT